MDIRVCSFTEKGKALGERIFADWEPERVLFRQQEHLGEWAKLGFSERSALVFIGAAGIAVRAVSPFVRDKLNDSPVIAADECGRYVIPLLSGHVGGANELAERIAKKIGAQAVITTATDVNHLFAADVFARRNYLTILDRSGIAAVSAKLLSGQRASVSIQPPPGGEDGINGLPGELQRVAYPPQGAVDILISAEERYASMAALALKPKEYVLGAGCRRGKSPEELEAFVREICAGAGLEPSDIACLASIDEKKEEPGLLLWAQRRGVPFMTFSAEELSRLPGSYSGSAFVRERMGVDNVCERAAVAAAQSLGGAGTPEQCLVMKKTARDGMTAALARREWRLNFDEA